MPPNSHCPRQMQQTSQIRHPFPRHRGAPARNSADEAGHRPGPSAATAAASHDHIRFHNRNHTDDRATRAHNHPPERLTFGLAQHDGDESRGISRSYRGSPCSSHANGSGGIGCSGMRSIWRRMASGRCCQAPASSAGSQSFKKCSTAASTAAVDRSPVCRHLFHTQVPASQRTAHRACPEIGAFTLAAPGTAKPCRSRTRSTGCRR